MTAIRTQASDFRVTRLTTKRFTFAARLYDAVTGQETGPIDLTGATIRFTAKRRFEDVVPVISKTIGAGITVDGLPTAGNGTLILSASDTAATDPGKITKLVFSLEVTEAGGDVTEIAHGTLVVDPKARLT